MNKKLIKQLEGVGFEFVKEFLELKLDGFSFIYTKDYLQVCALEKMNPVAPNVYCPTFVNILNSIKWHTGADLTKKTKREEIEELKKQLKKFNSNFENYRVFSEGTKDELKERIEQLEAKTKGLNLEYRFDEKISEEEIVAREAAKDNVRMKKIYEQGIETKPAFEVGDPFDYRDPVVIEPSVKIGTTGPFSTIKDYQESRTVLYVFDLEGEDDETIVVVAKGRKFYFTKDQLQHAPKEAAKGLKFADLMELLETFVEIETGEIVVFINKSKEGNYNVVDKGGEKHCLHPRYLKRL